MVSSSLITLLAEKILAKGWGTLTSHEIALTDGKNRTRNMMREVYDHGNAAAILLLDQERKMTTLVRQFRLPAHLNGDDGFMLEVCAGLLDGDTPLICAQKEATEETGIRPHAIEHAFDIYASPGSLTEKVHCFVGFYTEADRVGPGGGLADEGEDIEVVEMPMAGVLAMMARGGIVDAKTLTLIQHAALNGLLA